MALPKALVLLALSLSSYFTTIVHAQENAAQKYSFHLNLTNVKDDKLQVTLQAPVIRQQEVIYNMPKIVPGTYSVSDFGKFVSEFTALDKNGQPLPVKKLDTNRWQIGNATKLDKITYWTDDTFDAQKREDVVFEPGGTNIEAGKNFLLNTFGFIGYFSEMKQLPYELTITKPQGFYGSTPLVASSSTATSDTYLADNYMHLADSPLMYNKPDTTVLEMGNTEVLVSVYSPSGRVTSGPIAATIQDILEAQRNYLGGTLPVNKYAFLIYVPERVGKSGSFGALEHSYSSVYFLPEMPAAQFSSTIRDVAAHEFFHIVTPLTIHSEEIGNFDYINPKMSKHLWLYEGVTEYFAGHVQIYENLYGLEEYLAKLRAHILEAKFSFNDTLPFTEMSANVLDTYEKEYGNVYQKGALIGLVLDIELREKSGGKYGLRDLMLDLSKTYGKQKAFKDEELFDKIASMTYPEIRTFFKRYVEGSEPLPLQETFRKVGILYEPVAKSTAISYGGFIPGLNQDNSRIIIADVSELDAFGKQMGFREGDVLLKFNDTEITPDNVAQLIGEDLQAMEPGSKIKITVERKNSKGRLKKKKLKGRVTQIERQAPHLLEADPSATPAQKQLRAAWLNK